MGYFHRGDAEIAEKIVYSGLIHYIACMARLTDATVVIRRIGLWGFIKRLIVQINEDNVMVWAAAMAYSWLFAIFPFFIFLLTLVPYMPGEQKEAVLTTINRTIDQSLPEETAKLIRDRVNYQVERMLNDSHRGMMSLGILLTLWAASGGMAMTMSALDRCYDIDINRPFYKQRPLAIGLTVVVTVLLLLIMALLPVGTIVLNLIWKYLKLPVSLKYLVDFGRWAIALGVMVMLLNVIYHFGTQVKQPFRFITPGALFSIVMWIVLGLGLRYYVNRFAAGSYDKTYGAVGGVVILLMLFYLDALVLLIGAEINSEIDYTVLNVPNGTLDLRNPPSISAADPTMPTP